MRSRFPTSVSSGPHTDELDLGQLIDRIADTFPSDAALLYPAKRIEVEPEATCFVDPQRADVEIIDETKGEALRSGP